MRTLSSTLLAAQRAASRVPYVKAEVRNDPFGAINLKWERLYTGSESDSFHAVTIAGDGSMIRLRIGLASDNKKLYRQRVTAPGPGADFSQWTYLYQYNDISCSICSNGSEVSIFWIKSNLEIDRIRSTDNGATWSAVDYPGYAASANVTGTAAAYKPNGDLALFFTDTVTLYVIKRVSGAWQSRAAWDKSTGNLSGVAVIYDGDWKLLVCGQDSAGNFKVWSLVYGDGGEAAAGTWTSLNAVHSAPAGAGYEFGPVFLDNPDVLRYFCNEKYTGDEAYNRPLQSSGISGMLFTSSLWREPKPFDFQNTAGLALVHDTNYAWLSCPSGVWRAPLAAQSLSIGGDILALKGELEPSAGKVTLALQNNNGQYSSPGHGSLAILDTGCRVDLSLGYRTSAGSEYSPGLSFTLQGYEHLSAGGKASLVLYATDAWEEMAGWSARYPLRWNASSDEACVKDILAYVLARVGLKLEIIRQSAIAGNYFPDFTIQASADGRAAVLKLLSFVPDRLFIEGEKAYLVNPLSTDVSIYSYGTAHAILEGRYRKDGWAINRVQVEGWDPVNLRSTAADAFAWAELNKSSERLVAVEDRNIETATRAHERGETVLRKAEMEAISGYIRVPLNCGQQLPDVIDITDSRAGLAAAKKRVVGIALSYLPSKGEYENKIYLGAP